MTNYCLLTFFMWLLVPFQVCCQSADDSAFYNKAINNIKATYFSAIKENSHLYNGIQYDYFGIATTGSPFFKADTMHRGSVFYDDFLYEDIPLRYDMVNDVVVVKYYQENNTVQLIQDKVDYFSIPGHRFIRLNTSSSEGTKGSFFEVLYQDDKTLVLAKRFKKLTVSSNAEEKPAFVQYNQYFIYKDEKYAAVNSENDLAKIFKDKSTNIRKFIGTSKLKYNKDPEQVIVSTASFYQQLTK